MAMAMILPGVCELSGTLSSCASALEVKYESILTVVFIAAIFRTSSRISPNAIAKR
jgi:hypothetical protein